MWHNHDKDARIWLLCGVVAMLQIHATAEKNTPSDEIQTNERSVQIMYV